MTFRGLFIVGFFVLASLAALVEPFWGLAAYVLHYHSHPERTWWGKGLADAGVRYSFAITAFLAVGTVLNLKKLPYGRIVVGQELLYIAFLGWCILVRMMNGQQTDEDSVGKMVKLSVFILSMTHILTNYRQFDRFLKVLVICGLYLGFECYSASPGQYTKGRLEGVGGPDFSDSNALAAHMVALLPLIGVVFLTCNWKTKMVCFLAGGLLANGVVQTRSRGGYLAAIVAAGVMMMLAPKGHRWKLALLLVLGTIAAVTLVDAAYFERMGTLRAGEREKDESAMSRLRFWEAGYRMAIDHPLGVGPGNFVANVGEYLPADSGRDTHNTYIRCLAELGWPGLGLLGSLIGNAYLSLARVRRSACRGQESAACSWSAYGLQMSLSAYLMSSMFISATYTEMTWWLLLLPAALERASGNADTLVNDRTPVATREGMSCRSS